MLKVKIMFCEFWFKDKNGRAWYKAHFMLDSVQTAWVPCGDNLPSGTEITLSIGRDKEGRATLKRKA